MANNLITWKSIQCTEQCINSKESTGFIAKDSFAKVRGRIILIFWPSW
jgi:hypothetical protein